MTVKPFNEKKARKQYNRLRRSIHRAFKKGDHNEAERLTRVVLESTNCIRVTALNIWSGMKEHKRPKLKEVLELADSIYLWKPCDEVVWVKYFEKEGKNHDHRPIMRFGLENKIRQVHVREVLKPQAGLRRCQYVMHGGREAAVEALQQHYLNGHRYLAQLDIANCFSNLKGEGVYETLPLPKEVTRNVVMSSNLNLHTSNTIYLSLGELEDEVPLEEVFQPEDLEAVRWGIPQGSSAAPLCAEMILRDVIDQLPELGKVVNYADNFVLMCEDANAVQAMSSALWTALDGHPAGPLTPGFYHIYKAGEPFDFLGYRITFRENGSLRFDLGPRPRARLDKRLTWLRCAMNDKSINAKRKALILGSFARSVVGFRRAFPLWRGGDHAVKLIFSILKDLAFVHALELELPPIKQTKKEFS